jgi:hypothetical protein
MGCRHICRDECLLLSLLSSLQHKDDGCAGYAIRVLTGGPDEKQTRSMRDPSTAFAGALREAGEMLLPVPFQVLHMIVEAPAHGKSPSPIPLNS